MTGLPRPTPCAERSPRHRLAALALACVVAVPVLSGCAAAVIGGAAVGTLVALDRRTSGIQLEDEGIELRAGARLRDALGEPAHVNVTSYNRQVLLSGEVPTDQARQQAEQIAQRVENVRSVVNDLAVMPKSTLAQRSNDALITGKVSGEGGDRAGHRAPDGPRDRARGRARDPGGAARARGAEGGARFRDHQRAGARGDSGPRRLSRPLTARREPRQRFNAASAA